jgi:hypothetical protein
MAGIHRIRAWVLRLSAVLLTAAIPAQAMTVVEYDKMAGDDQDEYVADLIIGAQNVLRDAGRADAALRVHDLFGKVHTGSQVPLGMGEFRMNLARARLADIKRVEANPSSRRLEVEDAMVVTLRKIGIELPKTFFDVGKNFKPKYPPQSK